MKMMNGFMVKMFLGVFLLVMVSILTPQQALAYSLVVGNPYSETLWLAVESRDANNEWHVRGWWNVAPESTNTFNLGDAKDVDHIYAYAHANHINFKTDLNGTQRLVMDQKFDYKVQGEDHDPFEGQGSSVWFTRIEVDQDGVASWMPEKD